MSNIDRKHTNTRMSKIVQHGGLVFLCGQTSSGSSAADIDAQTREALSRIDALLAEAGSDRSRLLSVTVPPGAGSAAATQGPSARGRARLKPPGPRRPPEEPRTRLQPIRGRGDVARRFSDAAARHHRNQGPPRGHGHLRAL